MSFTLTRLPFVNEAVFDSITNQSEPMRHPETRINLLKEVKNWAQDTQNKYIFWLNGMAGTGKSIISRTIALKLTQLHQLGASFFFKRGEGDRSNTSKFFTLIATQLGQYLPILRPYLKKAVETDPIISTKNMKEQFKRLILLPILEIKDLLTFKLVLVVNTLDECENKGHIKLILHLAELQRVKSLNMHVFVTSRPELPIRLGFKKVSKAYQDLILHKIPKLIITYDISIFLRSEFARIRDKYNLAPFLAPALPLKWPSKYNF